MKHGGFPRVVLIVRHGEKPLVKRDTHLSDRGRERARMLARAVPQLYRKLSLIFAAAPSIGSNRPYETVSPLARALRTEIDNSYGENEYQQLADFLLSKSECFAGATIMICWHHGKAQPLARALGAITAPKWSPTDFSSIWALEYKRNGTVAFARSSQPTVQGARQRKQPKRKRAPSGP